MERPRIVLDHRLVEDHPDTVVVTLAGSMDPSTTLGFKTAMQALVADGTRRFIFNCEQLTYINSTGLAYLVNLMGEIEPEGGTISLAAVDPKIRIVLKMMGLLDLFKFYPTSAAALEELRSEEEPAPDSPPEEDGQLVPFAEMPAPVAEPEPEPEPEPSAPAEEPREERPPAPSQPAHNRGNPILRFFRFFVRLFGRRESVG